VKRDADGYLVSFNTTNHQGSRFVESVMIGNSGQIMR
jgi:hypothetical protein